MIDFLKFKEKEGLMKTDIPEGFTFSSVEAGIKYEGRDDLALIYCEKGANVSGVFTTNIVKAAPVIYSKKLLNENKEKFNAILINSGNANACTGDKGLKDCLTLSEKLSQELNVESRNILLASTGVIGVPLPVEKILYLFVLTLLALQDLLKFDLKYLRG